VPLFVWLNKSNEKLINKGLWHKTFRLILILSVSNKSSRKISPQILIMNGVEWSGVHTCCRLFALFGGGPGTPTCDLRPPSTHLQLPSLILEKSASTTCSLSFVCCLISEFCCCFVRARQKSTTVRNVNKTF